MTLARRCCSVCIVIRTGRTMVTPSHAAGRTITTRWTFITSSCPVRIIHIGTRRTNPRICHAFLRTRISVTAILTTRLAFFILVISRRTIYRLTHAFITAVMTCRTWLTCGLGTRILILTLFAIRTCGTAGSLSIGARYTCCRFFHAFLCTVVSKRTGFTF